MLVTHSLFYFDEYICSVVYNVERKGILTIDERKGIIEKAKLSLDEGISLDYIETLLTIKYNQ